MPEEKWLEGRVRPGASPFLVGPYALENGQLTTDQMEVAVESTVHSPTGDHEDPPVDAIPWTPYPT
jgi:hypothetical protein